jgi:PAS domain S-box-containing protein
MPVYKRSRATPLTAELLRARRKRVPQLTLVTSQASRDYEAELRERDELHRLACEAGHTGSWYVRLDTQECTLSPTAAALFGLPPREMVLPAEVWRRRIDPGHLPALETRVRSAAEEDNQFEFEFKATHAEGGEYWLYIRGAVLRDASGRPVRIHGAVVDITAHKRDQDELKRLNETLEQRVAERTDQLFKAQEALRQSQKLESMGQLTGGIAHDFNNLLTPIMANLDLMHRRAPSVRDRRLIEGALKSADSAQILVQRLLAFARRQALQPARVDVPRLVEGMADLIGRTLGPRIRIRLALAPDLAPAQADPNQLEMAILNLSVNARDAMPAGGTLTILAANDMVAGGHPAALAPGAYLKLTIADTGIGMDERTCERAIEPFFSTKGMG